MFFQESEIETHSTTGRTIKKNSTNIDYTNNAEIKNDENIDNIKIAKYNVENINNIDDVDKVENKEEIDLKNKIKNDNFLNIKSEQVNIDDHIDNSENSDHKNRDNNFISLYSQSELQDIDDVDNNEYKTNNDYDNRYENYISLYRTPTEFQGIGTTNNIVPKSNSLTLGEVRQALNNGLLEDILPMDGPVYRVNSLDDINNIEYSNNNLFESTEMKVKKLFNNNVNKK